MHISVELHNGDWLCARELEEGETWAEFVKTAQKDGGVWLNKSDGVQPFVPYSEIALIWFDDETSTASDEDDDLPHKDLTIN